MTDQPETPRKRGRPRKESTALAVASRTDYSAYRRHVYPILGVALGAEVERDRGGVGAGVS